MTNFVLTHRASAGLTSQVTMAFPMTVNPPVAGQANDAIQMQVEAKTQEPYGPHSPQLMSRNFVDCLALVMHSASTGSGFVAHLDKGQQSLSSCRAVLAGHGAVVQGGQVQILIAGRANPNDDLVNWLGNIGHVTVQNRLSSIEVTPGAAGVTVQVFTG